MSFIWQTVLQGAVGFGIGAGTNDLAIRWLFATVFTKKRKTIADSVQKVISTELMSSDKIVARLSSPEMRVIFERNIRKELDNACAKATSVATGFAKGFRPFLPEIVRIEADAVGQIGSVFGNEARSLVAKMCADHLATYIVGRLPGLIEEAKVWDIIHDSIMRLDQVEMEILTRQVANRELHGITLWGGVIGAGVGIMMSIIMRLIG